MQNGRCGHSGAPPSTSCDATVPDADFLLLELQATAVIATATRAMARRLRRGFENTCIGQFLRFVDMGGAVGGPQRWRDDDALQAGDQDLDGHGQGDDEDRAADDLDVVADGETVDDVAPEAAVGHDGGEGGGGDHLEGGGADPGEDEREGERE